MVQVLYQVWDLWLEVYGKNLKIGDGTNKTYFLVMATWNNNEIDDGEMVSKRGTGNLSGDPHKSQKWIYKIKTLQIENFICSNLTFNVS